MHSLMLGNVFNVTVVQCGAWNAWGNGLLADRIKVHQEHGCLVVLLVQLADQSFVSWMSVCLIEVNWKIEILLA